MTSSTYKTNLATLFLDYGSRQSAIPAAMTRSVYRNDHSTVSGSQIQQRGGYSSPQTYNPHSQMYTKDRLSESCLSVTAFTDHSSTPSPSGALVTAKIFDDNSASTTTPRKKISDSGSDGNF